MANFLHRPIKIGPYDTMLTVGVEAIAFEGGIFNWHGSADLLSDEEALKTELRQWLNPMDAGSRDAIVNRLVTNFGEMAKKG